MLMRFLFVCQRLVITQLYFDPSPIKDSKTNTISISQPLVVEVFEVEVLEA